MQRLVGLDLLRALLILEGVFYHASLVISPLPWAYSSMQYHSYGIGLFFQFFHFFRMECFFILAGFFAELVLNKKGRLYYFKDRVKRLVLPFIFSLILICLPQYYFISTYISKFDSFRVDTFIAHLWFLEILIPFIGLHILFKNKINFISTNLKSWQKIFFILLCVLAYKPTNFLWGKFYDNSIGTFLYNFIKYISFYLIGIDLFQNQKKYFIFIKTNIKKVIFAILVCSSILFLITYLRWYNDFHSINQIVKIILLALVEPILGFANAFYISLILIYHFYNLSIKPQNKYINTIVNSALIIYLIHHPLVIFLSLYFDLYNFNIIIFFISISLLSLIIPLMLYLIFKKYTFFKLLFGLK